MSTFPVIVNSIKDTLLFKIIMGVLLISISAQIEIPLKPVPITLQTMAILYIGLTYNLKEAFYTIFTYLLLGIIGLPIFTKLNFGLSYAMGPTGGYLISFIPCALLISYLRNKFQIKSWIGLTSICLSGTLITFILGISWLSTFIGLKSALMSGFIPFIIPGILKALLLIMLLKLTHKY